MNVISLAPAPDSLRNAPLSPLLDRSLPWSSATEPMDLDHAYEQLAIWRRACGVYRDLDCDGLSRATFGTENGRTMTLAVNDGTGEHALPVRETAFKQLCTRVGAPARYVRELPAHLQMGCLNHGLRSDTRSATLRVAGGAVRAIVSTRYAPLDDPELFELLDGALIRTGYRSDVRVRGFAAGKRTVLRITLPGEGEVVRPGDVVEYGIDVTNSELGIGAIQVTPVTYRLVCTNGMRSWSKHDRVRVTHRGEVERVRAMFRDAIPLAFAQARGDVDLFRKAAVRTVPNLLEEVSGLGRFGLTAGELGAVTSALVIQEGLAAGDDPQGDISGLLEGRSSTIFDVANAVTAAARSRSVGRRLELESAGHRYLQARAA